MAMFIWRVAANLFILFTLLTGISLVLAIALPSQIVAVAVAEGEDEQSNLYLLDVQNGLAVRITSTFSQVISPAWSPDGTQLAFIQRADDGDQIYIMSLTEPGIQRLRDDQSAPTYSALVWSPSGQQILVRGTRGPHEQLFVFDLLGETATNATMTLVFSQYAARLGQSFGWSQSGMQIAFSVQGEGSENDESIYTVAPDGTSLRQITDNDAHDFDPAWSPVDDQLAFVTYRDGSRDIFTMSATGRRMQNLTASSSTELSPVWSPDGEWIAYLSDVTSEWDVYVMRADGSDATALGVNQRMLPIWSPDGAWLLLYGSGEAILIRRDGSEQRTILQGREIAAPPAWKPQ